MDSRKYKQNLGGGEGHGGEGGKGGRGSGGLVWGKGEEKLGGIKAGNRKKKGWRRRHRFFSKWSKKAVTIRHEECVSVSVCSLKHFYIRGILAVQYIADLV